MRWKTIRTLRGFTPWLYREPSPTPFVGMMARDLLLTFPRVLIFRGGQMLKSPSQMSAPPELSIVIPALNEERRLPATLEKVHHYLLKTGRSAEIIVVDDGSTDRTSEVVDAVRQSCPEVRRISNPTNHGKGFAVRQGMLEARGEIALFTDADLSSPIEEADKLLEPIRKNHCDVAIGSRAVDRSLIEIHQSRVREFGGILFNACVRTLTGLPFVDTQCGFKAFRNDRARVLFEQQQIIGFGFDPEILFLAQRHGLKIAEVPVRWSHNRDSKVNFVKDSAAMLRDLVRIRQNAARGLYPPVVVLPPKVTQCK